MLWGKQLLNGEHGRDPSDLLLQSNLTSSSSLWPRRAACSTASDCTLQTLQHYYSLAQPNAAFTVIATLFGR